MSATPPTLLPALVTPFTRTGDLDLEAHTHNLQILADHGLKGFLLGGSTGEGPLLEPGERAGLTTTARRRLGRRTYLLVGITAESVRLAMSQIAEAADAGADGVLVLTPTTLARTSVAAQIRFFRAVAAGSPLPVHLYSVPRNTGYALDEAAAADLATHPNIVGMKDSGGDAVRIGRIAAAAGSDFVMFNGASASVHLAIVGGAHGAITASTNYLPALMTDLVTTARRAPTRAAPVQHQVTAITGVVESHGVPGVKAASTAIGLRAGHPRAPLAPVAPRVARELVSVVI